MFRRIRIGSEREIVEVLDEPRPGHPGRIKHANGENADIEFETLQELIRRAQEEPPSFLIA